MCNLTEFLKLYAIVHPVGDIVEYLREFDSGICLSLLFISPFKSYPLQKKIPEVLLVGSECGTQLKLIRDSDYCRQWTHMRGRHAAVVALAYSGPELDIIACADFTGAVTLINAESMNAVVYLSKGSYFAPRNLFARLCFIKQRTTGDYLLAHTGAPEVLAGAIRLWNIEKAQKTGKIFVWYILCEPYV